MANPTNTLYVTGIRELERQLNALGKNFPKAKVRQAANKGANLPLKEARKNAPKETGELKRGIVKVEEKAWRRRKKMKKAVFQIFFDSAKNPIFQKPLDPATQGSRGGQTTVDHAYYPISQEYGWHYAPGKRTRPRHFIKQAIEATQDDTVKTVVDHMLDSIDKIVNNP
jgi:HK97 gp10 family phage protein